MAKKILFAALAALVAAATLIGIRVERAAPLQVERGILVAAPPATIVTEIARLQNWAAWSQEKDAPGMRRSYGGKPSGPGATYYWSTADRSIEGRLTVISFRPDSVELERELIAPKQRLTDYTFKVTPEGTGSRVVWSATGDSDDDFMGKALGKTEERDARVGSELEGALGRLKKLVESQEDMQAYRVEKSITIEAPDVFVLAEIMDFREWAKWFPREQLDGKMKRVYAGADAQPGATYYWSGNGDVGAGRISMISSSAEKVELEVELDRPIRDCVSDLVFTLSPEGAGTRVVWTVTGQKNAAGRALSLLASTPSTLRGEMEAGLAAMKSIVESSMSQHPGGAAKLARQQAVALKKPAPAPAPVAGTAARKMRRVVLEPLVMQASK